MQDEVGSARNARGRLLDWLLDPLVFPALELFHGGCR